MTSNPAHLPSGPPVLGRLDLNLPRLRLPLPIPSHLLHHRQRRPSQACLYPSLSVPQFIYYSRHRHYRIFLRRHASVGSDLTCPSTWGSLHISWLSTSLSCMCLRNLQCFVLSVTLMYDDRGTYSSFTCLPPLPLASKPGVWSISSVPTFSSRFGDPAHGHRWIAFGYRQPSHRRNNFDPLARLHVPLLTGKINLLEISLHVLGISLKLGT
jgi:hypothetical protein